MKKVAIVQARMSSTRLPGKVLMDLGGRPLLTQQLQRLKRCRYLDDIVIATTPQAADEPITELAADENVACFRGSVDDVLGRFVGAARKVGADVVVRITGDCPLLDPEVADEVISALVNHRSGCDYASNILERTYPRGLDVEALYWDTLLRLDRLARSPLEREHVTLLLRLDRAGLFLCQSVADTEDHSDLRWTVDEAADLELARRLYEALDLGNQHLSYRDTIAYVLAHPKLSSLNAGVETWSPERPR